MKLKLSHLAVAALLATTLPTRASILWDPADNGVLPGLSSADLSGDISWYNDSQEGTCYRVRCVDTTTTDNRERAEFTHYADPNQTVYVGWKSRLDLIPSSEVRTVFQYKAHGAWTINYPITIEATGNTYRLRSFDTSNTGTTIWSTTLPDNQWFSIVLKVNISTDPNVGYIELWYNGVHQTLSNGSTRWTAATFSGSSCDFHFGIYRSDRVNGTEYHYILRPCVATTYGEADPIRAATLDTTGIYQLQNQASLLVLNNQGSLTNGSKITQWSSASTSDNLRWHFSNSRTTSGYYEIVSQKSGLDAVVQSASTASGAGIIQFQFGSAGNDQWKAVANSDGSYTFYNLHSGLVLEDPANSTSTSTQMDQWTANGGANQKWKLIKQ